jgi:hypothetical protein
LILFEMPTAFVILSREAAKDLAAIQMRRSPLALGASGRQRLDAEIATLPRS